jgi:hypothetical protein
MWIARVVEFYSEKKKESSSQPIKVNLVLFMMGFGGNYGIKIEGHFPPAMHDHSALQDLVRKLH